MKATALAIALVLMGVAAAESWTVQTAAFQDYRQASSQISDLRALGFDAYSEFVMRQGRQFVRVRIGCFTTRGAAESFARDIRGRVTAEAAAQPLTSASGPRACVSWDVGFVKPSTWSVERSGNDIVFRVQVAGEVGYLHRVPDGPWLLDTELRGEPDAAPATGGFREVVVGGARMVRGRLVDGREVVLCGGRLLWHDGSAAVVERASSVVACVLEQDPAAETR